MRCCSTFSGNLRLYPHIFYVHIGEAKEEYRLPSNSLFIRSSVRFSCWSGSYTCIQKLLISLTLLNLSTNDQMWLFWVMFVAFAVKMPIFPFHTWQPDTYEQSPTAVTMVLSGIMVKMGVFGVLRWLIPVLPYASYQLGDNIMTLSIAGMIYASLIAIKQDDIKRLVAYSSIAH